MTMAKNISDILQASARSQHAAGSGMTQYVCAD
jgi:hypothetical protein